jgi:hypothetical protein
MKKVGGCSSYTSNSPTLSTITFTSNSASNLWVLKSTPTFHLLYLNRRVLSWLSATAPKSSSHKPGESHGVVIFQHNVLTILVALWSALFTSGSLSTLPNKTSIFPRTSCKEKHRSSPRPFIVKVIQASVSKSQTLILRPSASSWHG